MESIKKYFIQTVKHVEDNVEKPMDENYELNVHTIFNKTLDKKASFIIVKESTKMYTVVKNLIINCLLSIE